MKTFHEFIRVHTVKTINFKKKKMKLLTKEQKESYEYPKMCYICKEKFENECLEDKRCYKVRNHCYDAGEYRGAAHSIYNFKYSVPEKIPTTFKNRSNCNHHFYNKKASRRI